MKTLTRMLLTVASACALSTAAVAQTAPTQTAAPAAAPQLKKYVFVVLTNPMPGKDAEYNDWYTNVHLGDVVKSQGVKSAQRYKIAPVDQSKSPFSYLSIYEIETADLAESQKAMKALAGTPAMVISPALDRNAQAIYYEQITEKVVSPNP